MATIEALYRAAGEAEADGDFTAALRNAGEVTLSAPAEDYARAKLAMILSGMAVAQGRIRSDWDMVAKAQSVCREVARQMLDRGRILLAIAACRAGLDLDPSDPEIWQTLEVIHEEMNKLAPPFGMPPVSMPPQERELPQGPDSFFALTEPRDVFERAVDLALSEPGRPQTPYKARSIPILGSLSRDVFLGLVNRMQLVKLPAEHKIIRQGEHDASVFIVIHGDAAVRVFEDGKTEKVASLTDGSIFGEMALINSAPRSATVVSETPIELFEITGDHVASVADEFPEINAELERVAGERLLLFGFGDSPMFRELDEDASTLLIRNMTFHIVPEGEALMEQDAEPTGLYLIVAGAVQISRQLDDGEEYDIATLYTGDVLGEMALLGKNDLTNARAAATEETVVFHLDHLAFESVVAKHPHIRTYLKLLSASRDADNRESVGGGDEYDVSESATAFLVI